QGGELFHCGPQADAAADSARELKALLTPARLRPSRWRQPPMDAWARAVAELPALPTRAWLGAFALEGSVRSRETGQACKRGRCRRRLLDVAVRIALAHQLAAVGAGEVHAVAFGRRNEPAHLLEPVGRQPALAPAALNGEAVGGLLVGAAELVAALMGMDPQLHRCGNLREQLGIENEEARIGGPIIIELRVEH